MATFSGDVQYSQVMGHLPTPGKQKHQETWMQMNHPWRIHGAGIYANIKGYIDGIHGTPYIAALWAHETTMVFYNTTVAGWDCPCSWWLHHGSPKKSL